MLNVRVITGILKLLDNHQQQYFAVTVCTLNH